MLYLLFHLGEECYALEARQAVEVLPMVKIKEIPQSPPGVAGLINYHGNPMPVLDLSALATGKPAAKKLSTRIVVIAYERPDCGKQLLGLMAERATETIHLKDADFQPAGVQLAEAPYLGPVARHSRGLIQRVEILKLIPAGIQNLLFAAANG